MLPLVPLPGPLARRLARKSPMVVLHVPIVRLLTTVNYDTL